MSELVKSISIDNLLNRRDGVVSKVKEALALLAEAEAEAKAANVGFPRLVVDTAYALRSGVALTGECKKAGVDALATITKVIDQAGWLYLMNESGLRTFMDSEARSLWDERIYSFDVPDLNKGNVVATFQNLYDAREEMFERGVVACFKALSWKYKTNQPVKFGKRVILRRFLQYGNFNSDVANRVDDLVRAFYVLDGRPEPDHRSGTYFLTHAANLQGRSYIEGDYLEVTWYKKAGTAHILFKRPDLVDKLNRIIAKRHPDALPPPKGR